MRRLQRLAFLVVLLTGVPGCTRVVLPSCQPEAEPSPKSIDVAELIELFYGEKTQHGSTHFWSTAALPDGPVEWETDGVGNCDGYDCRSGSVVATIHGEPTHRTLRKYVVPGRWQITMTGAHAGYSRVKFEPDDSLHSDRANEIVSYVAERIPLAPHKCTLPNAVGWYSTSAIFRIKREDIPSAWIAFSNSSGSGGHYLNMELYNLQHQADAFECTYERVGAELWPPQFRAGWGNPPEVRSHQPLRETEALARSAR